MKKLVFCLMIILLGVNIGGAIAQDTTSISILAGEWWFAEEDLSTVSGMSYGAELMAQYQEEHPEIEFEIQGVPFPDLDTTQLAAMEAQQGPDIMIVNSVTVGSFIDRGYLMPMNPLIDANGLDTSIFFPGMMS